MPPDLRGRCLFDASTSSRCNKYRGKVDFWVRGASPLGKFSKIRGGGRDVCRGFTLLELLVVHLGSRSVLEYLLSPIQKTLQDAGRER